MCQFLLCNIHLSDLSGIPRKIILKIRFFIQNQLGAIITIIAFLPLVILIFTNKDMKGKQKGLVGVIAVIALVVAGFIGIDFDPASIEKYTQETARVESLMGKNLGLS